MTDKFEFFTGLRSVHVYCNTMNWVPFVGQNKIFNRECNNKRDIFDVTGRTLLKYGIAPIIVGHVSRELSQQAWYATQGYNSKQLFIIQKAGILP